MAHRPEATCARRPGGGAAPAARRRGLLGGRWGALGLLAMGVAASAQPDGGALYAQHCAACHQADGSGTVGLAPVLKGEHWARLGSDRGYLPMVLVHGLSGPIRIGGQTFVGSMPPFAQLDDESLAALATHLRKLQGGSEAFAAADVKAERDRPGSPPQTRQRRAQILGQ